MSTQILGPVVALVAWTLVMMIWLYATRFPALARKGISLKGRVGGKGTDLDGVVDPQAQWKAHNYNHLLEQPTLFYAICISLVLLGGGGIWINLWLAWAYVGFRVIHSLIQATTMSCAGASSPSRAAPLPARPDRPRRRGILHDL